MNMGTRFIATQEAPVHENVKAAIVAASELDTRLVMRGLGDSIEFKDIIEEVAGVYPRIMKEGDMDAGAWSCGMVAGLINDIPTCKQLIDRIMSDAEAIINERLAGFVNA
jgi:NAD(P)H-dependent flavin oxidoreductase YrpB (nitropropane dioxygenase family)